MKNTGALQDVAYCIFLLTCLSVHSSARVQSSCSVYNAFSTVFLLPCSLLDEISVMI